jgi:hypothetical protein
MTLSRSESRQKDKELREKRRRKTVRLSIAIIGSIILLAGAGLTLSQNNGLPDWLSFGEDGQSSSDPLTGDTGDPSQEEPSAQPDTPEEPPQVEGSETPEPSPAAGADDEAAEQVSLSFVGDMLPGEYISNIMAQNGNDFPYEQAMLYLSEPDIMAGNLELPITTAGTPIENTPYVYKGSPDVLPAMRDAGFDVMSLANNHALDQGLEGMRDTMKHLREVGIGYMGVGENDTEAFAPLMMEAKNLKVAYIGVSEVIPFADLKADSKVPGIAETYDTTRTVDAIAKAEKDADIVVVMVHWGEDGQDTPEEIQRDYARQYIDAGADLVIGSHPHVLQGFETYKGKWIAYSLGNFVYASYPSEMHAETGVLDAVCGKDGDCQLKFNPMLVIQSQPTPLEGEAAQKMLDRLTSVSIGAQLESDGSIVPIQ